MKTLRVLMIGYEVAPFFKRGGLGDVLGSLPRELEQIGVDGLVEAVKKINSLSEEDY